MCCKSNHYAKHARAAAPTVAMQCNVMSYVKHTLSRPAVGGGGEQDLAGTHAFAYHIYEHYENMLGYNVCFRGFSLSMEYSCSRLRLLHNLACAATRVKCEWRRIVVQGLCVPGGWGPAAAQCRACGDTYMDSSAG